LVSKNIKIIDKRSLILIINGNVTKIGNGSVRLNARNAFCFSDDLFYPLKYKALSP